MRKPRDYDAELKALNEKARVLKESKLLRLGELVVTTGADALDTETLAGALLEVTQSDDKQRQMAWRKAGEEYFRRGKRTAPKGPAGPTQSSPKNQVAAESLFAEPSKA